MPLHSGTRSRLLARVVVASVAASLVVSTMQLPGVKRNVAQAAGVATVDSYASLGSSRYFTVADNSAFDITGNITMAAWVRPDSTCIAASYCMIINKERAYEVVISSGLLEFAVNNSSANWANGFTGTGIPIRADVWTHIAVGVSRSTNTFYIFINGSLLYSRTSSTDIPSTGGNSTGAFTIGGRQNTGTYDTFFTGGIDEVRVYNTAVTTAAAVQTMMNTWGPADAAGLVAYYDFNEGSGTSLVNTIASPAAGTNLTANGSPTWFDVKTRTTKSGTHEVLTFPRSYLNSAGGWTVPTNVAAVDALVVAGGGGGGDGSDNTGWSGGGGGAGGMKTLTQSVTAGAVLPISVGGGGVRGSSRLAPYGSTYVERVAANGANSVFATTTATGGGGGGQTGRNGGSGGSGGGGGTYTGGGGTGIPGEGGNGGAAMSTCCAAGGGGGAGGVGANATEDVGGNGGIGAQSSITGSAAWYAGGGAGRGFFTDGSAQSGGTAVKTNGLDGTGAGGGGGGGGLAYAAAGFGANGVVVVSYASPCTVTTTTLEGGVTQVVLTNPGAEMNCMSTWTSPVGVTMVDAVIVGGGGGGGGGIVAVNEPVTVYFTGGTSNFQKSAAKTLKTTAVAAKNANVVFVGGYTGNVTTDAVNEKLAEVRASKTRSALREAGVTATIAVMSFGSSGAVTKGKSNAEQNRNRRAVIYIVP